MDIGALIRRYAAASWRHRWKALLLAWLVCGVGWIAVYRMPDVYQANARVYADVDAILGSVLRDIATDGAPERQVETLQRTLLSRPNLERVVARTDLDLRVTDPASREALIERLGREIRIMPQTRSLFRVEFRDHEPRMAHAVVQTVINLFIEAATSTDRQQMQTARQFVAQQLASYETQLRAVEQKRAEFRARYIDLLPSDSFGGVSKLDQARGRLTALRGQHEDSTQRRILLQQQLANTPATLAGPATGGGGGGDPRLATAERNLRDLLLRFTDQHPEVLATRAMIAELRAQGARGGGGGGGSSSAPRAAAGGGAPNPLHEQLKLRVIDSDSEIASLERQIRDVEAEVERLENLLRTAPQLQAEYVNLNRDYDVLRRNYEELLSRRESLQIAGAARTDADRVRLEVVEPPTVPLTPIGPNRLLFATGVLFAGLGAGGMLALLLVQLDRGFYTVHDLRKLGLPVLGAISSARPVRRAGAAVAFAAGLALLIAAYGVVVAGGPALMAKVPNLVARLIA
jgi:polysaccharide chain length determinant protein (PEP-CTERM system associated)